MSDNLSLDMVYHDLSTTLKGDLDMGFLRRLLASVVGDIYDEKTITRFARQILQSKIPDGNRGGGIDLRVGELYWFRLSAFESQEKVFVGLSVEDSHIFNEQAMMDFANRSKATYEAIRPWHAYVGLLNSTIELWAKLSRDKLPFSHIFWLNFYSPDLVASMGREKIFSAVDAANAQLGGGVVIEELADGGLMIKAGKVPSDYYTGDRQRALEKILLRSVCNYCRRT